MHICGADSAEAPDGMVRRRADWMRKASDETLLEFIAEDGNMTPLAISEEGDVPRTTYTRNYCGQRLRILVDYGLLYRLDRGLFGITNIGEAYLEGKIDANLLEPVDDEHRSEYDLTELDAFIES